MLSFPPSHSLFPLSEVNILYVPKNVSSCLTQFLVFTVDMTSSWNPPRSHLHGLGVFPWTQQDPPLWRSSLHSCVGRQELWLSFYSPAPGGAPSPYSVLNKCLLKGEAEPSSKAGLRLKAADLSSQPGCASDWLCAVKHSLLCGSEWFSACTGHG